MPCKGCEKECKCTAEKCDERCKCAKGNKCNCHVASGGDDTKAAKPCCMKTGNVEKKVD